MYTKNIKENSQTHIVLLNYFYNKEIKDIDELLSRYITLTGWAEGLTEAGARVTVFQRFSKDATLKQNDIEYKFVSDNFSPMLCPWNIPSKLHSQIRESHPEVVHVNGLLFPVQTNYLRNRLSPTSIIVAQNHAERPWKGWRRFVQRWGLRSINGFLFTTRELSSIWIEQGIIPSRNEVYSVMEGSTRFNQSGGVRSQESGSLQTDMKGTPVFIWVGRLDENKDPLTVLRGFERAIEKMPEARLYMIYNSEELLSQVRSIIEQSSSLRNSVRLLGDIPHQAMEHYYNSADYFVLGSHYEGSGYALVEALACGLVPIVTDIPSFNKMTDQGRIGGLWPPGDAEAFARAIEEVTTLPVTEASQNAHSFFMENLSFSAIGRQALDIYKQIMPDIK